MVKKYLIFKIFTMREIRFKSYAKKYWSLDIVELKFSNLQYFTNGSKDYFIEIIWNIYENKDLLDKNLLWKIYTK